jgi:hypothetical protein
MSGATAWWSGYFSNALNVAKDGSFFRSHCQLLARENDNYDVFDWVVRRR